MGNDSKEHINLVNAFLEKIQKLLLLGYEGSGTSTIFKQVNAKQLGNISTTAYEVMYLY